MLSYLHAFHAGNFADVQKHAALALVLTMMHAKKTAIACFDTHAGSAIYDLESERARKTAEADEGVRKLWPLRSQLAASDWAPFIEVIADANQGRAPKTLQVYPGSPAWFAAFSRPGDSVTAFELHPSEEQQLARWGQQAGIRVRHEDGLKGLLKSLPPPQPRLLALIDPSYEVKSDYESVAQALTKAWKKCRHGVFLVWYPILTSGLEQRLLSALKSEAAVRKTLRNEVRLQAPPERGMMGSGMLVVNPPWGFEQRMAAMMEDLQGAERLGLNHTLDWLVPE
ncbi:23S rRNA (adenine(2030)-N(6))-methyltransferase RlmJ [Marinobacter fuscus]|uniref:Ribosomal RNA large subunit methyltransferase J n=1 Tax=Marinobacter fuscus TaxID=2109942 RepID=A0A2T1K7D8_9GAMM|nr:23S rRNA (adenine(2030)-N(6))-methyltransferase RlmJ [Marinobacter fuscus]PSF06066.1 23S rRNA (adenine(2030)-N(6))-methyltransferase RlmJ [Marinobacter fuscus]